MNHGVRTTTPVSSLCQVLDRTTSEKSVERIDDTESDLWDIFLETHELERRRGGWTGKEEGVEILNYVRNKRVRTGTEKG